MKIGTSLNFSAYSREGELSLCDSLSVCVDAGFDLIEIDLSRGVGERALAADNWEDEIKLIRNEAERAGARIVSVHAPHNPRLYMPEGAPSINTGDGSLCSRLAFKKNRETRGALYPSPTLTKILLKNRTLYDRMEA